MVLNPLKLLCIRLFTEPPCAAIFNIPSRVEFLFRHKGVYTILGIGLKVGARARANTWHSKIADGAIIDSPCSNGPIEW